MGKEKWRGERKGEERRKEKKKMKDNLMGLVEPGDMIIIWYEDHIPDMGFVYAEVDGDLGGRFEWVDVLWDSVGEVKLFMPIHHAQVRGTRIFIFDGGDVLHEFMKDGKIIRAVGVPKPVLDLC